jgi:uncharacterized protein (DUF1015 family)
LNDVVPRFEPFAGWRYDAAVDLGEVTAPPYDVLPEAERDELARRSPRNVVHVDVPRGDGDDPYAAAARRLTAWQDEGTLAQDDEPSFYLYRMGFRDLDGRARQTSGVIGALAVGEPDVLPHERTTPKARSDRLALLRATGHNLSPVWGLSLAEGLSALAQPEGPPLARCTDGDGVHHRLWRTASAGVCEAISGLVASAPVVIADGHHRYETSLAYRDERRAAGDDPGPADLAMALVVELAESELSVQPIHRLFAGLPPDFDLVGALEPFYEALRIVAVDPDLPALMDESGAVALLVSPGSAWLLRPRPDAFATTGAATAATGDDVADLDTSRLDVARATLPDHEVVYQHGVGAVVEQLAAGAFDAAVLVRPASVAQIAATARAGDRMPPKTTYFAPKPRTGFVLRAVRR